MKTITLSTRLTEDEAREIDQFASMDGLDRAAFIKQILRKGMNELKIEKALSLYQSRRISLSRASELCGLSIDELLHLFPSRTIELNYDLEELERDLS